MSHPRTIGEERDWARLLAALESIARNLARLNENVERMVGKEEAADA